MHWTRSAGCAGESNRPGRPSGGRMRAWPLRPALRHAGNADEGSAKADQRGSRAPRRAPRRDL